MNNGPGRRARRARAGSSGRSASCAALRLRRQRPLASASTKCMSAKSPKVSRKRRVCTFSGVLARRPRLERFQTIRPMNDAAEVRTADTERGRDEAGASSAGSRTAGWETLRIQWRPCACSPA
eukprot:2083077-Rhodomonas_salina.2